MLSREMFAQRTEVESCRFSEVTLQNNLLIVDNRAGVTPGWRLSSVLGGAQSNEQSHRLSEAGRLLASHYNPCMWIRQPNFKREDSGAIQNVKSIAQNGQNKK